jgi:hypothetical protein
MDNRRQYMRTASDAMVEMSHPQLGTLTVRARDLSEGGISVDMGHHVAPPVGTVLKVRIKRHTGSINSEPLQMRVVHVQSAKLVGLSFI